MSKIESLPSDKKEDAKSYLCKKEIPQLFESLTAGLLHHKPDEPVRFMQLCLAELNVIDKSRLRWDTFIEWKPPSDEIKTGATVS